MLLALFKRTALVVLTVALGTGIANAQIVLTVDTENRTLTWSGTATSDEFTVDAAWSYQIRLGIGDWIGGTGGDDIPESAFAVSSSNSLFFVENRFAPTITTDSLYVVLGHFPPIGGSLSTTVTVTGSGTPFSYLETNDTYWLLLGSLDDESLYFQGMQGGIFNHGDAAGFVAVIPEPSTVALLLGGLSALLVLKRRRA